MATAFSRTIRSLTVDGSRHMLLGVLAMSLLLGGWVAWCLLARIAVYAVTQTARLESVIRAITGGDKPGNTAAYEVVSLQSTSYIDS